MVRTILTPVNFAAAKRGGKPSRQYDIKEIKIAARGVIIHVAGIGDDFLTGSHGPCPRCGGTDRWRALPDFDDTGGCICSQCGTNLGDGLAVIQWATGCGFPEAVKRIGDYLDFKPASGEQPTRQTPQRPAKGDPDLLDRAYSLIFKRSPLKEPDREELRSRGLSDSAIAEYGIGTLVGGATVACSMIGFSFKADEIRSIPGLIVTMEKPKEQTICHLALRDGILIPIRDLQARLVGIQIRNSASKIKYQWLSSRGGASSGTPANVITGRDGNCDRVVVVEGILKSYVYHAFSGHTTVGIAGGEAFKSAIEPIRELDAKQVAIAFDADATTNLAVAKSLQAAVAAYREIACVSLLVWPAEMGKGIDDVLNNGHQPAEVTGQAEIDRHIQQLLTSASGAGATELAAGVANNQQLSTTSRADVVIIDNELEMIERIIAEGLSKCNEIYVRGGELQRVVESSHPLDPAATVLQIRRATVPFLRTLITSKCRFLKPAGKGDEIELIDSRVPGNIPQQVADHGHYRSVRELIGVSEHPFMRPDGSICFMNGYDPATRIYLSRSYDIDLPESLNRAVATASKDHLLGLVEDFEFASSHHKSAWLAGLLTVFARPAIRGAVPLMVLDASTPGAGKSLLVDMISAIAFGRPAARNPWPGRDEELAKGLLAIVMSGVPIVLFDNVRTLLGGQTLEALGTAESWKGRILGRSEETAELPVRSVFFFTSNNAQMTPDVARRSCIARLEPTTELPDQRDGFRYADILGHIDRHRSQLLSDVFAILVAFRQSSDFGKIALKNWGGYQDWSTLIRGAIVWLGLPDPIQGMLDTKEAVASTDVFGELLESLRAAGLVSATSAEIYSAAEKTNVTGYVHGNLRMALIASCGKKMLSPHQIGKILQQHNGKILNGLKFSSELSRTKTKIWTIEQFGATESDELQVIAGDAGDSAGVQPDYPLHVSTRNLPNETEMQVIAGDVGGSIYNFDDKRDDDSSGGATAHPGQYVGSPAITCNPRSADSTDLRSETTCPKCANEMLKEESRIPGRFVLECAGCGHHGFVDSPADTISGHKQ